MGPGTVYRGPFLLELSNKIAHTTVVHVSLRLTLIVGVVNDNDNLGIVAALTITALLRFLLYVRHSRYVINAATQPHSTRVVKLRFHALH